MMIDVKINNRGQRKRMRFRENCKVYLDGGLPVNQIAKLLQASVGHTKTICEQIKSESIGGI